MKEYIEREAAIKAVCDSSAHTCDLKNCFHGCQEAQAILAIPAADVVPVRWIPVAHKMPNPRSVVLAWSPDLFTVIAYYNDEEEWDIPNPNITHWMPLPTPPRGETK